METDTVELILGTLACTEVNLVLKISINVYSVKWK